MPITVYTQPSDTSANWTLNNPVLIQYCIGYESDTNRFKVGDGITAWNNLAYATMTPAQSIAISIALS